MINSTDFFYNNDDNNLEKNFSFPLTTNNNNNYNIGNLLNNPEKELINRSGVVAKTYYRRLISERDYLKATNLCHKIPATIKVLQAEIDYLRSLFDTNYLNCSFDLPPPQGMVEVMLRKIFIPVDKYPDYNFVGRILGPRGLTAKELEAKTGCKIMIRGRGSMKDKSKEESFIGKPNFQHLKEPLHVLLQAEDTPNRVNVKLDYAEYELRKMLFPTSENFDTLKKSQLVELAILNGTYRKDSHLTTKSSLSPTKTTSYQGDSNIFKSLNPINFSDFENICNNLDTTFDGVSFSPHNLFF